MKNYVQPGKVIHVVLAANIASGGVLKIGSVIGIAATSGVTGDTVAFDVSGVFTVTKKTVDVVTQGLPLYWDATNNNFTITSTSNTLAGYAWTNQSGTDTVVDINLFLS